MTQTIHFIPNTIAENAPDTYAKITVDTDKIFESWRYSITSMEWLDHDGNFKTGEKLSSDNQEKLQQALQSLQNNNALECPILGIGIQDNIEIGTGRAHFVALAQNNIKQFDAYIRKSQISDFKTFLS